MENNREQADVSGQQGGRKKRKSMIPVATWSRESVRPDKYKVWAGTYSRAALLSGPLSGGTAMEDWPLPSSSSLPESGLSAVGTTLARFLPLLLPVEVAGCLPGGEDGALGPEVCGA